MTIYNPAIAVRIFGFFQERHFFSETEGGYPLISIYKLQKNLFLKPRASVIGKVENEVKSTDGDLHVNIQDDNGRILVAEIVPEYPLKTPPVGAKIKVWGVTRYDLEHRWWELHPVFGWELIK